MLIAGYDGEDTRTVCNVVANGGIVEIDGMEAVVATLPEAITSPVVEEVEPVVEPEVDPAEE